MSHIFIFSFLIVFLCAIGGNKVDANEPSNSISREYAVNKSKIDIRRRNKASPKMGVPLPKIKLNGFREYETGGNRFKSYKLLVTNFNDFNNELFTPAPSLPPCGLNKNSSRAWVKIYDNYNRYLYGFCGLESNLELKDTMSFMYRSDRKPPKKVYIEINDRLENIIYRSKSIRVK